MLEKRNSRKQAQSLDLVAFERWMRKQDYSELTIEKVMRRAQYIKSTYCSDVSQGLVDRVYDDYHGRRAYDTTRNMLAVLVMLAKYRGVSVELPKLKRVVKEPQPLDVYEMNGLFNACETKRDFALVQLFAVGGLRVGEVSRADKCDLDGLSVWVRNRHGHTKSRRERRVALNRVAVDAVRDYLAGRGDDCPALFVTGDGRRLTTLRIERIVSKLGGRAGIQRRVYPHLLRHSALQNLCASGVGVNLLLSQSGHASVQSLLPYIHRVGYEQLSAAVRGFSY